VVTVARFAPAFDAYFLEHTAFHEHHWAFKPANRFRASLFDPNSEPAADAILLSWGDLHLYKALPTPSGWAMRLRVLWLSNAVPRSS
jgi:hypothetical protein